MLAPAPIEVSAYWSRSLHGAIDSMSVLRQSPGIAHRQVPSVPHSAILHSQPPVGTTAIDLKCLRNAEAPAICAPPVKPIANETLSISARPVQGRCGSPVASSPRPLSAESLFRTGPVAATNGPQHGAHIASPPQKRRIGPSHLEPSPASLQSSCPSCP